MRNMGDPQGGGGGGVVSGPVKKVFVGGIAHGTTEDDIRAYFSQFGPVSSVTSVCVCVCFIP